MAAAVASAASGFRFARYGPIADVLQLEKFSPVISNAQTQVLIQPKFVPIHRTEAALVNGTAHGQEQKAAVFPKVAGFEGIATVVDSAASTTFKNGDWVYVSPNTTNGTWCSQNVVSSDSLVAVPQSAIDGNPLASCVSCFITAAALVDAVAAAAPAGKVTILQNGGSSLTALAVSALGKQKGFKVVTAASSGARFSAAVQRHKAFGSDVVSYSDEGARAARKLLEGSNGASAFINGVGGRPFNEFLKLTNSNSSLCITYGAQQSYGLLWAGSQLVYKNLALSGFYLPRYLAALDAKGRQEKVAAALELAKALKGQYPVEAVKSLDAVPAAWDKLYLEGGFKPVIQL